MLSVVIPTRNRAPVLKLALQSLTSQTLPSSEFEVLVIDNGSTDDTKTIAESFSSVLQLRYSYEPAPGLHVGRHRGLKEAQGEVIVYADDDIAGVPTWLEAVEECFQDGRVAIVGGNNYPAFEGDPPRWLEKLWNKPAFGGQAIPALSVLSLPHGKRAVDPLLIWGCNFSIRKDVVVAAGGFHPDGMPEELIRFRGDGETYVANYVIRAGLESVFDSRASVHHRVDRHRMTFEYFQKRAFNQGVSDSYTSLRRAGGLAGPNVPSIRAAARVLAGRAYRAFVARLTEDPDLRKLGSITRRAYQAGYSYHQDMYFSDPEVRGWVHRADYLDAGLASVAVPSRKPNAPAVDGE